jgi:hypothetical protein
LAVVVIILIWIVIRGKPDPATGQPRASHLAQDRPDHTFSDRVTEHGGLRQLQWRQRGC